MKALMKGREGHLTCLQIPDKFYLQVCNALQPTNRRKGCGSNRSIELCDLMKWGCVSLQSTLRHAPIHSKPQHLHINSTLSIQVQRHQYSGGSAGDAFTHPNSSQGRKTLLVSDTTSLGNGMNG